MAPSPVDKQPATKKTPHDWLVSLAMDLATVLCVICGGANDTSGCHLAVFSKDVAFACHFVAARPPPPSHPVGVLVVLTTPVKNDLKWRAIQLGIHSTVGA